MTQLELQQQKWKLVQAIVRCFKLLALEHWHLKGVTGACYTSAYVYAGALYTPFTIDRCKNLERDYIIDCDDVSTIMMLQNLLNQLSDTHMFWLELQFGDREELTRNLPNIRHACCALLQDWDHKS